MKAKTRTDRWWLSKDWTTYIDKYSNVVDYLPLTMVHVMYGVHKQVYDSVVSARDSKNTKPEKGGKYQAHLTLLHSILQIVIMLQTKWCAIRSIGGYTFIRIR